jgi:hypothetical protein
MMDDNHGEEAIRVAEAEVAEWLEEVRLAKASVEREQEKLRQAMKNLDTAKAFLELLAQRYGSKVTRPPIRFPDWRPSPGLRDMALGVIQRRGRASPAEIIADLQDSGFQFGRFPRRQLHFALLNNDKAVKDPSGTWHWKGAGQVEMSLAPRPNEEA